MTAATFVETIANMFVEAIESGNVQAWRKPWADSFAKGGLQVSAITKKPYAGANQFMLMLNSMSNGYKSVQWITIKQANEHFMVLKEGQQPTTITKFFRGTKTVTGEVVEASGEVTQKEGKISTAGYVAYQVYNLSQFARIPNKFAKNEDMQVEILRQYSANEMADQIIENSQINIVHGGNCAKFVPAQNTVFVPDRNTFNSCEEYYATVFHEMIHATGPKMNRKFGESFGDVQYAKEELIAEIGASMMLGMCGLDYPHMLQNHVAYLASWSKIIKDKKTEFVKAANSAYVAFEYLTGYSESIG